MVAPYDTSKFDNATGIFDLMEGINEITSPTHMFAQFFLLAVILVSLLFAKNKGYDTKDVFLVVSFSSTSVAVLLWSIGFIGWGTLSLYSVFLLITLFIKIFGDK